MKYNFHLIVESELDEVVCELSCLSLEALQEELVRKAEIAIKKYEADKEVQAQAEFDRQQEEKLPPNYGDFSERDENGN
jgi:hypothetical protein